MHYNTNRYHKRMNDLKDLMGGKCVNCGNEENLQMHHIDPSGKSFTISNEFDKPWVELVEESKKCELRCLPCHRLQHAAKHGSLGKYSHGKCRCDLCRAAVSVVNKIYKKRAKERKLAGLTQRPEC